MALKYENEITVVVTCDYDELTRVLVSNGYSVTNELRLVDTYMFEKSQDIYNMANADILRNYVLVRVPSNNTPQITYKYKEINPDGSISRQGKANCDVRDEQQAISLLECLGYEKSFVIDNIIKFYEKGDSRLVAAYVNDEYLCIEYSGVAEQTIEEVIADFKKLGIPYDESNYFVNKAMIELDKIKSKSQKK